MLPWEKGVLALGICIYLILLAGCAKLLYDRRRLKKHAEDALARAELARERSSMRSSPPRTSVPSTTAKEPEMIEAGIEVPSGARTTTSGNEIDRPWTPRSDSLVHSFGHHSTASLLNGDNPDHDTMDLNAALTDPVISRTLGSRRQSRSLERLGSKSDVSSRLSSDSAIRYPPDSYVRYENGRRSRELRARISMENVAWPKSAYGSKTQRLTSGTARTNFKADSNRGGRSSSVETILGGRGSQDERVIQHDMSITRRRSASCETLDLLQAHRLSHVAETGQLVPRVRRAGHSGEWASLANFRPIVSGEVHDFSLPVDHSEMTTPPGSASSMKSNPFTTPSREKLTLEIPEPQSASTDSSYEMLPTVQKDTAGERTSFYVNRPESQVLREVNSGFSVLKPGSLSQESLIKVGAHEGCIHPPRRRSSLSSQPRLLVPQSPSSSSLASLSPSQTRSAVSQVPLEGPHTQACSPSTQSSCASTEQTTGGEHEGSASESRSRTPSIASEGTDSSAESEDEAVAPWTPFSETEILRRPSPLEIARGAEFERNSIVKFSFEAGQRPPSAMEVARGAELESRGVVKYTFEEGQRPASASEMRRGRELEARMKYRF